VTGRLFHIVARDAWTRVLSRGGPWSPPSLDAEGFVHLSFAEQLQGTLDLHFPGPDALVLLEVDRAALERRGDALRLEPSRGGALFPHLYGPIRAGDVLRTWPLPRAAGRRVAPHLGTDPVDDDPPGDPPADRSPGMAEANRAEANRLTARSRS